MSRQSTARRVPAPTRFRRAFRIAGFIALFLAAPASSFTAEDKASENSPFASDRPSFPAPDAGTLGPPIEGRVDPDTYRVGPGDEFAFRHSDLLDARILRVGPAGEILLPDAGAVSIAGLTLREAEAKIREILRAYVRGKGLVFTLYRPRRFRLPVLGEVRHPGVVTLAAPARASEAIDAAGGIVGDGARRGIVVRRGADSLRVDLVRYIRAGDLAGNPLVFETDVVFIPPAGPSIEIHGSVPHGGRYDLIAGDRVGTLIALAGGHLPEAALDQAELERFDDSGGSERIAVKLNAALSSPGGAEDLLLRDRDRLFIPARSHFKEGAFALVHGEVVHPGPYAIRDGVDGFRSLLDRAGGLTEFADASRARIERRAAAAAQDTAFLRLAREHDDLLTEEERGYVKLHSRQRNAVSIDLSTVLAGGASGTPPDIVLVDGDRIVIPRRFLSVSVQGEVRSPGYVAFEAGRGVSYYARAAGGFTHRANPGRVRVTLARTDQQVSASEAGPLNPGDTVWVPAKREHSAWGRIRDGITTVAQVATVFLVIREATK